MHINIFFNRSTQKYNLNVDLAVLFLLIILNIIIRSLSIQMIESGGDAITYWGSAKNLLYGISNYTFSHKSVRFGIIVPVLIIQKLFGTHPLVYFITPLVMSILQVVFLYFIGLKIHSRIAAFLGCVLLILFPEMSRYGGQILPGVFSGVYILGAIFFLIKFQEDNKNKYLVISSIFLFIAYETKITNLFFFPMFVFSIFLCNRSFKEVAIFLLVLLFFYFLETFVYYLKTDNILGKLGIIMGSYGHSGKLKPMSFIDLLDRYSHPKLKEWWRYYFYSYIVGSFIIFFSSRSFNALKKLNVRSIVYITFCFFFIMTFSVKSISPVIPVTMFHQRYLSVALPLITLIISISIIDIIKLLLDGNILLKNFKQIVNKKASLIFIYSFIIVLIVVVFVFNSGYLKAAHPFRLVSKYHKILNNAYENGVPIVGGCSKTHKLFLWVYWDGYSRLKTTSEIPSKKGERIKIIWERKVDVENRKKFKKRKIRILLHEKFKDENNKYKSKIISNLESPVVILGRTSVKRASLKDYLNGLK